jgi:hypothetical protein
VKVTNIDLLGNWRSTLAAVVDDEDDDVVVCSFSPSPSSLLLSVLSIVLLLLDILSIERVGVAEVLLVSKSSSSGKAERGVQ